MDNASFYLQLALSAAGVDTDIESCRRICDGSLSPSDRRRMLVEEHQLGPAKAETVLAQVTFALDRMDERC